MTYVFESQKPHLIVQVRAGSKNTKSKSVEFLGHYFATDDEKIAKSIMSSGMFSETPRQGQIWVHLKAEDGKVKVPRKSYGHKVTQGPVGTT